ncbi:hypothetical protein [uncultured Corynebacterium sp.]|uniref:hypothetical protein n=1 Tax=uncultured Corynebacterium sp. TaxID=159447 RepID=UPI002594F992|nr:hypothetical protein [uncultured Corynebacterium sp.]
MTDPVLQADLDALGRLHPELMVLAWQVSQGVPHEIPSGGRVDEGAVPSLAAAQEMSTRTLPMVQATVAARFSKLAEMIELARQGFIATDEQLLSAVATVPSLQRSSPST